MGKTTVHLCNKIMKYW